MPKSSAAKPFDEIRKAGTSGPNYEIDNADVIKELTRWQKICSFTTANAEGDSVEITFKTLPKDMNAFVRDLYEFCPDLVDQGTGCVHEMVEAMEEAGEELDPKMKKLIEGVDFSDEDYGLEILKRELVQNKKVKLWWD